MVHQFLTDETLRKQAVKALHARSPLYKLWTLLATLCFPWGCVCYMIFYRQIAGNAPAVPDPNMPLSAGLVAGCVTFLFAGVPLVITLMMRYRQVTMPLSKRVGESITLTEQGIQQQYMYCYTSQYQTGRRWRECFTYMYYKDIQRMEYYRKENALKIYGKTYFCKAEGEPAPESIVKILDKSSNAYRIFFMYYNQAEQLMHQLEQLSHMPISIHTHCPGSLDETINKGVG